MSNQYNDFEKRYTNEWFSSGWSEIEIKPQKIEPEHKDLATLEVELELIKEKLEGIEQNRLRLSNLAKLYSV